jgi:hypothetical protein
LEVSGQHYALAALLPEKYSGAHLIGGWVVGLRAGLDVLKNREISFSCQESNPVPYYSMVEIKK